MLFLLTRYSEVPAQQDFMPRYKTEVWDTATIIDKIYQALNTPDSAQALLKTARDQARLLSYRYGMLLASYHLANTYMQGDSNEKAISLYSEVIADCRTLQEKKLLAPALNGLGYVYYIQGKYEDAIRRYQFSGKAIEQYGATEWVTRGSVYNNMSTVLIVMKQYKQALSYLEKAEAFAMEDTTYRLMVNAQINKVWYI